MSAEGGRVTYGTNSEEFEAERWRQYVICRERGHEASGQRAMSNPPKDICKHCGCYFWTTLELHETNVPVRI